MMSILLNLSKLLIISRQKSRFEILLKKSLSSMLKWQYDSTKCHEKLQDLENKNQELITQDKLEVNSYANATTYKTVIFIIYKVKNFQLLFMYLIQVKSKRKYENQNLNLSTIYLRYHKAKTIKKTLFIV